jgi:hypothetical protein
MEPEKMGASDIADIMGHVKAGRRNLPIELERMGGEIATFCGGWTRDIDLKI